MSKIIRICIVVILVIVPFCSVSAQDEGTVLFGPIAGGNFSQMLEGGLKEIQPGFSAGMFVRWRLGTVFATRVELQYSQRGGKRIWEGE